MPHINLVADFHLQATAIALRIFSDAQFLLQGASRKHTHTHTYFLVTKCEIIKL